ncbi:MAG: hypothetical protein P4L38_04040 [Syntrophaceae bacterium]|nr:hypothetical protein [Syntrophaceae bacterium]
MAASDNHSEDPKIANENTVKSGDSRQGPTRLTLTLLIVMVIIVTAVLSVYRNEVFSTIRGASAKVFSLLAPHQQVPDAKGKKSVKSGPEVSVVAPSTPTAEIDAEKTDRPALSSESSQNAPAPGTKSSTPSKSQENPQVAPNESQAPTANLAPATSPRNLPSLVSDLQKDSSQSKTDTESKSKPSPASQAKTGDQSTVVQQPKESVSKLEPAAESSAGPQSMINNGKPGKAGAFQEFQLPGSIRVKIHNYSGVYNKWALMAIVDNSAVMNRESKRWKPARVKLAKEFALALLEAIPSGSKIAMKDFSCKANSAKDKGPCPVHIAYDWSEYPYKGLKEKIDSMAPGNVTNPCGAVIGSIKRDFAGAGNHVPRLLLITCGQAKCPSKETSRVLNRQSPGAKVTVDVLAIGAPIKRHPTYSLLAKKSGGLFLAIETPAQLEGAMGRYKKALRVSTFQKVEIRNDKATVSVAPDEDIALAPGNYTVVLPKLKGIAESHRAIPNVKIKSGHATLIEVNPKKGKASIRVVDKQRSGQ